MKTGLLAHRLSMLTGVAALLIAGAALAVDVHVMISAGFYSAYSDVVPAFEQETGHKLITVRGPSLGDSPEAIPNRLKRGEPADVVIGLAASIDDLGRQGLVRPASKVDLARSEIGMVVRAGRHEARHRNRRRVPAHARRREVDRLLRQRQRHLPVDDAVREARRCGSGRRQEPQGAGTALGRAGCRGRCPRRGGDRLSAGERAHPRARGHLRRRDSGRAAAGDVFLGSAREQRRSSKRLPRR